jgi:hypothetical protein
MVPSNGSTIQRKPSSRLSICSFSSAKKPCRGKVPSSLSRMTSCEARSASVTKSDRPFSLTWNRPAQSSSTAPPACAASSQTLPNSAIASKEHQDRANVNGSSDRRIIAGKRPSVLGLDDTLTRSATEAIPASVPRSRFGLLFGPKFFLGSSAEGGKTSPLQNLSLRNIFQTKSWTWSRELV